MKKFMAVLAVLSSFAITAHAEMTGPANVIYVNGIMNTESSAKQSASKIKSILDVSANHQKSSGGAQRQFNVVSSFNPIGWYNSYLDGDGTALTQDQKELFIQKTNEEAYRKVAVYLGVNWYDTSKVTPAGFVDIAAFGKKMQYGVTSLEVGADRMPDDAMDGSIKAVSDLVRTIRATPSAIVVAHSQGNLLANLAYAQLASEFGAGVNNMFRIVNIANTTADSIHGLNLTHAGDAALFSKATATLAPNRSLEWLPMRGANVLGSSYIYRPNHTDCMGDNFLRCKFELAAPTFKAAPAVSGFIEHDFVDVYLSTNTVERDPSYTNPVAWTPGATRFVDFFEDLVYTAANSLPQSYGDEFEASAPDATHWDFGKTATVQYYDANAQSGVLETRMLTPDTAGYGSIKTKNLPQVKHLRLVIRHYIHRAGDFYPDLSLRFNISMSNNSGFSVGGNYWKYLDRWIVTTMDLDTATGECTIDPDSSGVDVQSCSLRELTLFPVTQIIFMGSSSFATDYHIIDYIRMSDLAPRTGVLIINPGDIGDPNTPITPICTDPLKCPPPEPPCACDPQVPAV